MFQRTLSFRTLKQGFKLLNKGLLTTANPRKFEYIIDLNKYTSIYQYQNQKTLDEQTDKVNFRTGVHLSHKEK